MINNPFGALDRFLHDRTGKASGIRTAGRMRAAFAVLYLIDHLLLSTCLNEFMSPSSGIIPIRMARYASLYHLKQQRSLLEFFPDSDAFLWFVWFVGLVHGILLLLGIASRWQLLGILVNLASFQHQNGLMWDWCVSCFPSSFVHCFLL